MAVALGRWCFGVMFFFFGISKLGHVRGFARFLTTQFEKAWLPAFLVTAFGYVLPFIETALGILLLTGLFRNTTLFATGVLLIVLTFGQIVLGQPPVIFYNAVYVFMVATLLFLERFDQWVIRPEFLRSQPAPNSKTTTAASSNSSAAKP